LYSLIQNALVGLTISFLGSLPLGVQNLTSVKVSLERGFRPALAFGAGCASIEMLYSTIAVKLTQFLLKADTLRMAFQGVSTGLFMIIGLLFLTSKSKHNTSALLKANTYYLGLGMSLMNMASIPFWLVTTTLMSGNGWIEINDDLPLLGYILGIPVGTMLALSTYAALSERLDRRFDLQRLPVNRVIGAVLLCLGLYGAVRMIWLK
jgi:threonine/homoserine/homoserine lactone efflux protein